MSSFASTDLTILPKLVLIFGDSGSGKSVAQNAFQEHSFVPLHPIQDLKTFLESMCDLPAGSLHTPKGKASVPNFYRYLNNKMDILFARKAFIQGIHSFLDTNTFCQVQTQFSIFFFAFRFP